MNSGISDIKKWADGVNHILKQHSDILSIVHEIIDNLSVLKTSTQEEILEKLNNIETKLSRLEAFEHDTDFEKWFQVKSLNVRSGAD